jgi:hypothetical protein
MALVGKVKAEKLSEAALPTLKGNMASDQSLEQSR